MFQSGQYGGTLILYLVVILLSMHKRKTQPVPKKRRSLESCAFAAYNFDGIILTWGDFLVNRRNMPIYDICEKLLCHKLRHCMIEANFFND